MRETPTGRSGPIAEARPALELSDEQRPIVEWGDGPLVVIAGAGTGKTRVIVERVRYLLETKGEAAWTAAGQPDPRRARSPRRAVRRTARARADPRPDLQRQGGPRALGAARGGPRCRGEGASPGLELPQLLPPGPDRARRRGRAPGPAGRPRRGRPAAPPARPVAGPAPRLPLEPGRGRGLVAGPVRGVHQPGQGRARHAGPGRRVRRRRGGDLRGRVRSARAGHRAAADARHAQARPRGAQGLRPLARRGRAPRRVGRSPSSRPTRRCARRPTARPDGPSTAPVTPGTSRTSRRIEQDEIAELAETYVADGAALEVVRLRELALVYRAYQEELARRGALDFGEQIAAVIGLFRTRPNVLRRYQRQYRYLLVDEFQDANVAQIELVELLGRTPDRPDNVMVVGDDDQSIYRFRGASYAAFAEFDRRFALPPAHDPQALPPGPPTRMRLEENHRSGGHVLDGGEPDHRAQRHALRAGQAPPRHEGPRPARRAGRLRRAGRRGGHDRRPDPGADATRTRRRAGPAVARHRRPLSQAQAPRGDRRPAPRRGHPVHRRRRAVAVRDGRDPRPRADPASDRRPAPGRRPGPDALGRAVAARPARDPGGRPDGALRPPPPRRRHPRGRRVRAGPGRPAGHGRARGGAATPSPTSRTGTRPAGSGGASLQPRTLDLLAEREIVVVDGDRPPGRPGSSPADALVAPSIWDAAAPIDPSPNPRRRPGRPRRPAGAREIAPITRSRLRRVLETIDELAPLTWREGPHTILERLLERTGHGPRPHRRRHP